MTSKRLTIIEAIVTHLEGLTVTNGYSVDVGSVVHGARIYFETGPDKWPLLDVVGGPGNNVYEPCSDVYPSFQVQVRGAIEGTTPGGVNLSGAEDFMADVKNRMADWRDSTALRANCIDILPLSEDIDGGEFECTTFVVNFTVRYAHDWGEA